MRRKHREGKTGQMNEINNERNASRKIQRQARAASRFQNFYSRATWTIF